MSVTDVLKSGYEAFNRGERFEEPLTDDFVLEQTPSLPGTEGRFRGAGGLLRAREELLQGFGDFRFDPEEFDERGDHVLVKVRVTSRTRGIEQVGRVIHVWDVRDGKLARCRVFTSRADALAAIPTR